MEEKNDQELQNEKPANTGLEEENAMLKAYQALEENSVSKEKYNKDLAKERARADMYFKAITEGAKIDTPSSDDGKTLKESIAELNKFKGTNLEYWQKMTTAVDKLLKETPQKEIVRITGEDGLQELVKVNEGMKQMVKDADGDPDYFRSLYNKRIIDSAPKITTAIDNAGGVVNYLRQNSKK